MATVAYRIFRRSRLSGRGLDLVKDDIRAALVTSAYTPDAVKHKTFSDVTGEVKAAGYSSGGKFLEGQRIVEGASGPAFFAKDLTWEKASILARGIVLYFAKTNELITYSDFGKDVSSTDDAFKVLWDSAGILELI